MAGSLVTEPAVRLVAGVALAGSLRTGRCGRRHGARRVRRAGGCIGRAPAWRLRPARGRSTRRPVVSTAGALSVGLAFVSLAVLQTIDLLVANRVLGPLAAAQFGVLSTLGGAAFFATATIPLVLMPAAVARPARTPQPPRWP